MTVTELIEHLSKNPEPSWVLDRKIADATNKFVMETRRYTGDLTAAIGLLPWGWSWMVGCAAGGKFFATVQTTEEGGMESHDFTVEASTPPLAMTIAAIKAWKWTKDGVL